MPRFVILSHDWPTPHWDFFLEAGAFLRSWRLLDPPLPGSQCRIESIPDHRLNYLDYEGPISGDRGEVRRVVAGTFEWIQDELNQITLQVESHQLKGRLHIYPGRGVCDLPPQQ